MKKLLLPLLLMVAVSAQAAENPVLTIEGGQVQGVLADDHPEVFVYRGTGRRSLYDWIHSQRYGQYVAQHR